MPKGPHGEKRPADAMATGGLGLDQRGAQYGRFSRHIACFQRARASPAVPSKPAGRTCHSVERPISGHAATGDDLFRGPGQLASAAASDSLDRTAAADPGLVPGLHGRFLGADADLRRGDVARAYPAQGEAWRDCAGARLIGDAHVS
jgi:hypothetical protein